MDIVAIIVAYRPDVAVLRTIMRNLDGQCPVIIADNSPQGDLACRVGPIRATIIAMHGNQGIGAAQNRAIAAAWQAGADAVLLLDDDSIPPPDLVRRLTDCATALGPEAVVGANAVDQEGVEISNARRSPGLTPACRDMMSSGTLIRRGIFERVGPFDESLFVDGVDFDWGWRASRLGYALHLCRTTAIQHRLGEGRVAGAGLPSPVRHYFQYRNVLQLMTRSHTPWKWRVAQSAKLIIKLGMIACLMPDRRQRLRFAWAGIRDAVRGRSGPLPAPGAVELATGART